MTSQSTRIMAAVEREMRSPHITAHSIAIDRLCMNMLAGRPSLEGVAGEYSNALAIERRATPQDDGAAR